MYNQRVDTVQPQDQKAADEAKTFRSIWNFGWGLDPKNNMPLEPNQQPSAGQRKPISTTRQASSIPKGGTSSTWQYPSPQMFFNALTR